MGLGERRREIVPRPAITGFPVAIARSVDAWGRPGYRHPSLRASALPVESPCRSRAPALPPVVQIADRDGLGTSLVGGDVPDGGRHFRPGDEGRSSALDVRESAVLRDGTPRALLSGHGAERRAAVSGPCATSREGRHASQAASTRSSALHHPLRSLCEVAKPDRPLRLRGEKSRGAREAMLEAGPMAIAVLGRLTLTTLLIASSNASKKTPPVLRTAPDAGP